jgi:hypothetical protein
MAFPDLMPLLKGAMPELRGRALANQPLAELTWFRVGGPAQLLFIPDDEADLAYFLAHLPGEFAVTVVGLGSNLIVRDGGVPGAVVRLGRGFNGIAVEDARLRAGAAVPDVKVARAAQEAGLAGLSFMRGIPGAVGGALRMNGGAYGRETKDVLVAARAVRLHFYRSPVRWRTRRSKSHCRRNGKDHGGAGIDATGKKSHRRFDFQESARLQSLAIDRCCRLPRIEQWRRPGLGDAL